MSGKKLRTKVNSTILKSFIFYCTYIGNTIFTTYNHDNSTWYLIQRWPYTCKYTYILGTFAAIPLCHCINSFSNFNPVSDLYTHCMKPFVTSVACYPDLMPACPLFHILTARHHFMYGGFRKKNCCGEFPGESSSLGESSATLAGGFCSGKAGGGLLQASLEGSVLA